MGRRLPPLPAIEAFLYAARSSSFRAAADQLALSPSAFSRRLQTLEAFIGAALFERSAPPTLTQAGRAYYAAIAGRLDEILAATEALRTAPARSRLRLMSPPSLAVNWLMPRYARLADPALGLDLDIVIGQDLNLLRQGRVDLALSGEVRDFTGLATEPLARLEGILTAPRAQVYGRAPPAGLGRLAGHRLVAIQAPADFCARWLDAAGYQGPPLEIWRYETWGLMYEAAANGFGLAVAVAALANPYLRDGRLAPCVEQSVEFNLGYRIAYANAALQARPEVRRLAQGLICEMNQSSEEYRALIGRGAPGPGGDGGAPR